MQFSTKILTLSTNCIMSIFDIGLCRADGDQAESGQVKDGEEDDGEERTATGDEGSGRIPCQCFCIQATLESFWSRTGVCCPLVQASLIASWNNVRCPSVALPTD